MSLAALALAIEPVAWQAQAVAADAAQSAAQPPAQVPLDERLAVGPDGTIYQPQDKDERGLWMQMDEAERSMKVSPAVMREEALNAYVRQVLCRTVGDAKCRNVRLYLVRTAHFNATMAPNGMMEVWSGLLLRVENEAQLATVLGHEYTHFERLHSLRLFRDIRAKTESAAWLSFVPFGFVASLGILTSIFQFSRDMEREADDGGLSFIGKAGYDTREAAKIWERLRAEMDATAEARKTKSRKDKNGGLFATHPPTKERVENLRAASLANPGVPGETGEARFRAAMAAFWPEFVDDQLKLNDFGASDFLLTSLGEDGWTPELYYARGELYRRKGTAESLAAAEEYYTKGIEAGGLMPALWRGRGLTRLKLAKDDVARNDAGKADLAEYVRLAPTAGDRAMMEMMAGGNT